jgi:hypothetical protein
MKWVLLFLGCAALSCNGGQGTKDAPPPRDTPGGGEGLYFQDGPPGPRDGPALDAPRDHGPARDGSRKDRREEASSVDLRPLDLRPLDLRPLDAPPDPCRTQWPDWSCIATSSGCNAMCSTYELTCVKSLYVTMCTCKHGTAQKTCSVTGMGCTQCSAAVGKGCCNI